MTAHRKLFETTEKGNTYFWEVVVNERYDDQLQNDKSDGYFEGYNVTDGEDFHVEGGLWFKDKVLVDYDGVFCLPKEVENTLKEMGFDTSEL